MLRIFSSFTRTEELTTICCASHQENSETRNLMENIFGLTFVPFCSHATRAPKISFFRATSCIYYAGRVQRVLLRFPACDYFLVWVQYGSSTKNGTLLQPQKGERVWSAAEDAAQYSEIMHARCSPFLHLPTLFGLFPFQSNHCTLNRKREREGSRFSICLSSKQRVMRMKAKAWLGCALLFVSTVCFP